METPFLDRYAELARPDWVSKARAAGLATYRRDGLPTARVEAWKYTNLKTLAKIPFVPAGLATVPTIDGVPAGRALAVDACRVVLVNGRLAPALSDLAHLPGGVAVTAIEATPSARTLLDIVHDDPLAALNAAYAGDGVAIEVAAGAVVDRAIHLISVGVADDQPVMCHPRVTVSLAAAAALTLVESHVGVDGGPLLRNAVTDIALAEGARLGHYLLQNGPDGAHGIGSTRVMVKERGVYEALTLTVGGALSRNGLHVVLAGEAAECRINGAYAIAEQQHVDNTLMVDHAVPHTVSRQLYKGVLDGNSRGVFQGRILVRRGARQTDGQQLHKALLLSRGAEVDCKPELEIYADDVKCSHGAAAGELDDDALFYLRARGLDPETARGLLIEAFLDDVVDGVGVEVVREAFKDVIRGWLAGRRGA